MSELLACIRRFSEEKFQSWVLASPKNFREELFRRLQVKSKSKAKPIGLKAASKKNEARVKKLREIVIEQGIPDELLNELSRNYLYTKRDMLEAALNHLGVENDHGLTEQELDFMAELDSDSAKALRELLLKDFDPMDTELYLVMMQVPAGS